MAGIFSKKTRKVISTEYRVELFGIAAGSSGVGSTFFSVLLANYQEGVRNKKTAVLEWNDSGDFEQIETVYCKKSVLNRHTKTFKLLEVSYVKKAGRKELLECVNLDFEIIVIDFGSNFEKFKEEFLRCDRKIVIGSFCGWKVGAFTKLIINKKREEGKWEFLALPGNKDMMKDFSKTLHISVEQIPKAEDAFIITGEIMAFFEGFLKY